jgi:hypothetical protein
MELDFNEMSAEGKMLAIWTTLSALTDKVDAIRVKLEGNGQPGIINRVSRLESHRDAVIWLLGIVFLGGGLLAAAMKLTK